MIIIGGGGGLWCRLSKIPQKWKISIENLFETLREVPRQDLNPARLNGMRLVYLCAKTFPMFYFLWFIF